MSIILTPSNVESFDNKALVEEEKKGYAHQYLVRHETQIRDPYVKERIFRLSVQESVRY